MCGGIQGSVVFAEMQNQAEQGTLIFVRECARERLYRMVLSSIDRSSGLRALDISFAVAT